MTQNPPTERLLDDFQIALGEERQEDAEPISQIRVVEDEVRNGRSVGLTTAGHGVGKAEPRRRTKSHRE